ncbi:hypothetical protein WJX72_005841 [[Myrmecia] bisecta]|uniref:Uncharacterized protein n=1 Tax=[Myrmecia] bisecta TaxID=41462 RepID=A0AAW1QF60_9CHLO
MSSSSVAKGAKVPQETATAEVFWAPTVLWTLGTVITYILMIRLAQFLVPGSEEASNLLFSQVPVHEYERSSTAFAAALLISVISLLFEVTPERKQLSLLTCLIKGIAWHADYLITTGGAPIMLSPQGQP